jgi:hypothetical protein
MTVPTLTRQNLLLSLAAMAVCVALLVAAEAVRLSAGGPSELPLADRREAPVLTRGFHDVERDGRGAYRWTDGDARAVLAHPGQGGPLELRLALGPAAPGGPARLGVAVAGGPPVELPVAPEPRVYRLLAPPGPAAPELQVALVSQTAQVGDDPRSIGVRVEALAARPVGEGLRWPAPATPAAQALILGCVGLVALRAGLSWRSAAAATAAVALALALLPFGYEQAAPRYLARLALAASLLAALTLAALPALERHPAWLGPPEQARALWGVVMLACAIRLAGALFPPFAAYDLNLNLGRLMATVGGTLVATNESFEFGGGLTVYPSGPYLVLMPGMLLGLTPKLAVQGGIALVDGLATLGVAALGRALLMGRRPLLFACLAYAAVPIALTTLYYGHTAQAFGQALMAPLAAALLLGLRGSGGPWAWLIAWALFSAALLSHIGVSILALAWLGLAWLALAVTRRLDGPTWRRLTSTLVLGGLAGLVFVYGPVVLSHLAIVTRLDFGGEGVAPAPAYNLIAKAWWIAYTPLGLLLAAAGLALLRPLRLPLGAAELLGAWAGAALLFWAVEMATGLQVRYLVFLTPIACLLAGLSLSWLAERRAYGRVAAWVLTLALLVGGAAGWFPGVFERIAPSMVPLLR